ncbi:MAG: sulfurtransferase [Chloroflexota bacterium]
MFSTLIEADELKALLGNDGLVVVDCRFKLSDPAAGEIAYAQEHIPGAVYAHLDRDLSGEPFTDKGRHPMLAPEAMNALFGRLGIAPESQVIIYDDMRGAIASRLWWMLRYMGHESTAVLNGGYPAWEAADSPTAAGHEQNDATQYQGVPGSFTLITIDEVANQDLLIDSRTAPRYRGEVEPLDPVAGHIPGAANHHFGLSFGEDGRFKPAEELAQTFTQLFGEASSEDVTFYCGSGVTACTNLLAVAHAGLNQSKLYGGSWSEWCRERPDQIGKQ